MQRVFVLPLRDSQSLRDVAKVIVMADQNLSMLCTGDGDYRIHGCYVHHIAKSSEPMPSICKHIPHRIRDVLIRKERDRLIRHIYAAEEESKLRAASTSSLAMSGYSWSI